MGKRDEKTLENRRIIIETAHRLFNRQGYSATTMNDIIKATGLTNGTIYHLYDSKQDILRAIYRYYFGNPIGLNAESAGLAELHPTENILHFLEEYEKRWMEAGWVIALHLYMLQGENPHKEPSKITPHNDTIKQELVAYLNHEKENGRLKQSLNAEDVADSIFIFGRGMLFQWAISSGSYNLAEDSKKYWDIFLPILFN